MAVCVTGWPKFGMSCIPLDVGDCMRLAIAVRPAYGGKTLPDCPSQRHQVSHFPVFDWLSTSLKYLAHSINILSTQVDLPFQCGTAVGFPV